MILNKPIFYQIFDIRDLIWQVSNEQVNYVLKRLEILSIFAYDGEVIEDKRVELGIDK